MADLERLSRNLKARGFNLHCVDTAPDAAAYLLSQIQETTVGIGGSKTFEALGVYDALCESNDVFWHWKQGNLPEGFRKASQAEVYISGVNAISETGELVNIDGRGNRVAALTFGEGKRIFLVASTKKLCPDLSAAIERAQKIAAPINVQKLPGQRPCSVTGSCVDCRADGRGCCTLQVMMFKPMGAKSVDLILIDEDLGY